MLCGYKYIKMFINSKKKKKIRLEYTKILAVVIFVLWAFE